MEPGALKLLGRQTARSWMTTFMRMGPCLVCFMNRMESSLSAFIVGVQIVLGAVTKDKTFLLALYTMDTNSLTNFFQETRFSQGVQFVLHKAYGC